MGYTSEHFSDAELACHHCGVNACRPELVDALEELRRKIGRPILITSAYRCPDHNRAIGGAADSQHTEGTAADLRVPGMTAAALDAIARTVPAFKGFGRADVQHYIHVDTREQPAQWCYDAAGKWCHWYAPPGTVAT